MADLPLYWNELMQVEAGEIENRTERWDTFSKSSCKSI
jgi:hypothetical protein